MRTKYLQEIETIGELVADSNCTLKQSQHINKLLDELATTVNEALKQANGANTSERQLTIPDVSSRRELLIAYGEWIHELAGCKDTEKATTLADSYLSNL